MRKAWMKDYWIGHSLFPTIVASDHAGHLAAKYRKNDRQGGGARTVRDNGNARDLAAEFAGYIGIVLMFNVSTAHLSYFYGLSMAIELFSIISIISMAFHLSMDPIQSYVLL